MSKKKSSKAIKAVVLTAAAAGTVYFGVGGFLYSQLLGRKAVNKNHRPLILEPARIAYLEQHPGEIADDTEWYAFMRPEHYTLVSLRGETLHANAILQKNESRLWAVINHGWTNWPEGMASYARGFYEMGYNILLPNLRGHELSEYNSACMGWPDRLDIVDWINYIVMIEPEAEIIIHGISMGAAATMMTTGEDLPDNVKCAVADCGYTSVWDEFSTQITPLTHLPQFPFLSSVRTIIKFRDGYDIKEASCVEQVRKSKTPTLFLHGADDKFVLPWMMDVLFDNAACEKEKMLIPDATHAASIKAHPEKYWTKIKEFTEKYI